VVGKLIYLRQHDHFGPAKIAMYRKRYHDISISHSGVWRVLKRLDLNRLPASQRYKRHDRRWKRYEQAAAWPPGPARRQVHRPAGWITPQALPIHRHRRLHPPARPAHLPPARPETAIQFADYVLERLPFRIEVIQTDNGAKFQSQFNYHLLDKGVSHIKPRTPRLNGKQPPSVAHTHQHINGCSAGRSGTRACFARVPLVALLVELATGPGCASSWSSSPLPRSSPAKLLGCDLD
jgi:hypothetical protein